MRTHKKISAGLVIASLLLPVLAFAGPSAADDKPGNYNMALISLVSLMLILLFVIGMLANTLSQLGVALRDKNRKDKQASNIVKTILLMLVFSMSALHSFAADVDNGKPVAQAANSFNGIAAGDFYAIMSVIGLEILVIFSLVIYIKMLLRVISGKPELVKAAKEITQRSWFWDNFNKAVPIEKEKDLLLDHNYDGIQELDNSLPPWWKYGFYLTIVVAVIYLYRYHVSHDGPSQAEEFTLEMQKGEEEKAAYLAHSANNVDETTVKLLTDQASLTEGHNIFVKTCAPCHVADGGGNVGPNLTDDYWLHGGGIKDVFKSIKYGWQDKGMKSWKDDFSPKQIEELASFVKSLKGTHPAVPKAPQGDLYIEATQAGQSGDSTKTTADTTKTGKVAIK